jgi:hypothetical protein
MLFFCVPFEKVASFKTYLLLPDSWAEWDILVLPCCQRTLDDLSGGTEFIWHERRATWLSLTFTSEYSWCASKTVIETCHQLAHSDWAIPKLFVKHWCSTASVYFKSRKTSHKQNHELMSCIRNVQII